MLGVVVELGRCLVHVVGRSAQSTGKCEPWLWNSGSCTLGGGVGRKRDQNMGVTLQMERHIHPTDGKTEAQVTKGVHSFDIYRAQVVGQALGIFLALRELTG